MEWISTKDRLPENEKTVAIIYDGNIRGGVYLEKEEEWLMIGIEDDDYAWQTKYAVKYWMPIPSIPEDARIMIWGN